MTAIRDDLIASAVRFLQDEKVTSAPMTRKLAFLESKGLTQAEIDLAVSKASSKQNEPLPHGSISTMPPPSLPTRVSNGTVTKTWGPRDVIFTLAAVGAVGGTAYHFLNKYVISRLPSYTALSEAQKEFQRALIATSQAVDAVQADARAALSSLRTDADTLAMHAREATNALKEVTRQAEERDLHIQTIAQDLEQLKTSVPEMVNSVRESQTKLLENLQMEIRSLRTSLMNPSSNPLGNGIGPGDIPSPSLSAITPPTIPLGVPKIPDWQRKAAAAAKKSSTSPSKGSPNADIPINPSVPSDEESLRSTSPQSQVNVSV